ncbi:tRNA (adenosine(37)-N6)-threonylcarbamoyltransferase complex dimerization subunit type 1 TsaB [Breoghania sp.]|uniref:tRNA (adenosine(37)-N6)-threonylcarbamoyltransferase complex dimerization subunit type 1 TsaB n=1 Tax=Breoghania sp. TaxID=2065378 RepID=UPI002627DD13|nr:tRNA (adenosine(37)-N6)-threonylcarbamoyltransferase complex dimerization subunit type 1 TsaB [Breoghania sp.]MDJ0930887.1 tRNA (adenosine(37)-N6)-threonylcarbamoyltransferase complex dimerization subunit type 1 TsaB [Breoghania sp.]
MTLLALDTALSRCSTAVLKDDGTLTALSEELGRGHAERLADMVSEVMAEAGVGFADLKRIAVTVGPGSFTGLRVALSLARGFAVVWPAELVGVTTLAAIAEGARKTAGENPLAVALPARAGEVYAQLFDPDGAPVGEPEAIEAKTFAERLPASARLVGAAADRIAEIRPELEIVDRTPAPDIASVARLGLSALEGAPMPLYLKPPDAKPQTRFRIAHK